MAKEFKRIILKISGEALSSKNSNLDFDIISSVSAQIKKIVDKGVEVCLVVGGGNIKLLPINDKSTPVDKIIGMVPEVVDKVNGTFQEAIDKLCTKKNKKKKDGEEEKTDNEQYVEVTE